MSGKVSSPAYKRGNRHYNYVLGSANYRLRRKGKRWCSRCARPAEHLELLQAIIDGEDVEHPAIKPLAEFGVRVLWPDGSPKRWNGSCKSCETIESRRYRTELRKRSPKEFRRRQKVYQQNLRESLEADPEKARRWREMRRKSQIKRTEKAKADARVKALRKAAYKRWWDRTMADPKRHAALLEGRRITYRVKREREGFVPKPVKRGQRVNRPSPRLPGKPLAVLIDKLASENELSLASQCAALGVSDRAVRHWSEGESSAVNFTTADKVLTAVGLLPWDVWDEKQLSRVIE